MQTQKPTNWPAVINNRATKCLQTQKSQTQAEKSKKYQIPTKYKQAKFKARNKMRNKLNI